MTDGAGLPISRSTYDDAPALSASRASRRGWLGALLTVYLVLLAWVVLWKLEVPYLGDGAVRHVKLVPFAPTAEDGASEPLEVVANVVLFVPFGLYLGLLAPARARWKLAGVIAGASLALEVTQYVLAVGSTDITDLIVNTAGGLVGLGLIALARHRLQDRTVTVLTRVCSIGTALFLVAAVAFIASPMHYAPLRDVHIPRVSAPEMEPGTPSA